MHYINYFQQTMEALIAFGQAFINNIYQHSCTYYVSDSHICYLTLNYPFSGLILPVLGDFNCQISYCLPLGTISLLVGELSFMVGQRHKLT